MRKFIFKCHSYLALVVVLPLLVIALTGSILVFKFELDRLLMPAQVSLDKVGESRKSLGELHAYLVETFAEYELGSWELFDDGIEADRVYLIKRGTDQWFKVHLDPYQGKVLSPVSGLHHQLTDWLLLLHYTLLLDGLFDDYPRLGLVVGMFVALVACLLGISGLILYKKFWQKFFSLQWDFRVKVMLRRLHRFMGIWSAPVLLLSGITGAYFNLMEYLEEIGNDEAGSYVVDHSLYNKAIDLDAIYADAKSRMTGFRPNYLLMPYEPDLPVRVYGDVPGINPFASAYGSNVSYDGMTGKFISAYDIRKQGFAINLVDSFREIHFGSFAGMTSKILWCVVGLGIGGLGLSGLLMWGQRKRLI